MQAVAVRGLDPQLVAGVRDGDAARGGHNEFGDDRVGGGRSRSARGDPGGQRVVLGRADFHPPATAVRDLQRRLFEKQALLRLEEVDAALRPVADDISAVGRRVETEDRELEPGLAILGGVAGPHVAAELTEDGCDVPRVADRRVRNHVADCHRHAQCQRPVRRGDGDLDFRPAISHGGKRAACADVHDRRDGRHEFGLRRQVARPRRRLSRVVGGHHDELSTGKVAGKLDQSRRDGNGDRWRRRVFFRLLGRRFNRQRRLRPGDRRSRGGRSARATSIPADEASNYTSRVEDVHRRALQNGWQAGGANQAGGTVVPYRAGRSFAAEWS